MSDLVEHLRGLDNSLLPHDTILREAADEIERLRAALEEIAANMPNHVNIGEARKIARKALNPDERG